MTRQSTLRAALVAALLVATLLAAALLAAAPARAGTFRVSQCAAVADGGLSPRGYQAGLWSVANAWPEAECGFGTHTIGLGTGNWRLLDRDSAVLGFGVPAALPRTTLRTTWLDWRFANQAPSTNPAFLIASSSGARLFVALAGDGTPAGAADRLAMPGGARQLELRIWCSPVNGPGYCNWVHRLLDIRGLTAELEESELPSAAASGPLLAPGAHAGVEPLELTATDGDSGVRRVEASLGGIAIGTLEPAEGCRDDRLPPCPQTLRGTLDVDTRRVPDGARRLRLVVTDAAGNRATLDPATIEIENPGPPAPPDPGPPAAPGPGSGSGTGSAVPPSGGTGSSADGRFPPNPLAGRGHAPNGRGASERASAQRVAGARPQGRRRTAAPPQRDRPLRRPRAHPRAAHRPARPRDRAGGPGGHPARGRRALAPGHRRPHPRGRALHGVHPDRPVAGAAVRLLRVRRLSARPREPAAAGPRRPLSPSAAPAFPGRERRCHSVPA